MKKAALIALPIGAVVALFVLFYVKRDSRREGREEPAGAGARRLGSSGTDAELARLRAEVDSLRTEKEAQRKRAEAAEAKLATPSEDVSNASSAEDAKKAAAKKGDWKKRRDSELEAKIKSIDWRKRVKGLIDYWKEVEKARAEGRAPHMNPEMIDQLTKLQSETVELAKMLGLENDISWKAFQNVLVAEAWGDSFLQEMTGGSLTEDQLAKLRQTDIYKDDDSSYDLNRNFLEQWHTAIEHNRAYGAETLGILTPEQHAQVTSTITPTYMLSVYASYSERVIPGTGAAALEGVSAYWQKNFQIPAEHAAAVQTVAAEYVRRHAEIAAAVSAQYGGLKSRDAEFAFLLQTIEAQMEAEKKLSETLQLTAEQLKLFQKGSGSVIKLGP